MIYIQLRFVSLLVFFYSIRPHDFNVIHTSFFFISISVSIHKSCTQSSITITVVGSFKLNIKFFEEKKLSRINVVVSIMRLSLFTSVFLILFIDCKSIRCDDLCFWYGAVLLFVFCPLVVDEDLVHVTHAVSKYFMGQIKLFAQSLYWKRNKKQFKTQILTNKTQVTNKIRNTTLLNRIFSLLLLFTAITCRDAQTIWVIHETSFPVMEKITSKSELLSNYEYLLFE